MALVFTRLHVGVAGGSWNDWSFVTIFSIGVVDFGSMRNALPFLGVFPRCCPFVFRALYCTEHAGSNFSYFHVVTSVANATWIRLQNIYGTDVWKNITFAPYGR
jgi:hypothetical protein